MSECVVRMEMPNGCHDCKLRNMVGNCPIPMFDGQDEEKVWTLEECFQRPPWCPILCQLPEEHGRLVDEDELFYNMFVAEDGRVVPNYDCNNFPISMPVKHVKQYILETPTIIPAERAKT